METTSGGVPDGGRMRQWVRPERQRRVISREPSRVMRRACWQGESRTFAEPALCERGESNGLGCRGGCPREMFGLRPFGAPLDMTTVAGRRSAWLVAIAGAGRLVGIENTILQAPRQYYTSIAMAIDESGSQAIIGRSIARLRISRGISQRDLAARAQVGITSLQRLEAGRGGQVTTLIRVIAALGATSWLHALAPALPPGGDSPRRERRRVFAPRTRRPRGTEQADGA